MELMMNTRFTVAALMALTLACPALAQDKKDAKPKEAPKPAMPAPAGAGDMGEMMKMYEELAKPGAFHAWLAKFEGEWETSLQIIGADGVAMPAEKGTMSYEMEIGGRYLEMEYLAKFMGKDFEGGGTLAYNNVDKRFESVWWDSMSTGIMMMTGQADADGKVLTMSGEATEADGSKSKMKEVMTIISQKEHRSDFYRVTPDGKEMKTMVIAYKQLADKPAEKVEKGDKGDKGREGPKDQPAKGKGG